MRLKSAAVPVKTAQQITGGFAADPHIAAEDAAFAEVNFAAQFYIIKPMHTHQPPLSVG
jgi:hypothetical protein